MNDKIKLIGAQEATTQRTFYVNMDIGKHQDIEISVVCEEYTYIKVRDYSFLQKYDLTKKEKDQIHEYVYSLDWLEECE